MPYNLLDKEKGGKSCKKQKVWMDPCKDQRDNNFTTKGNWKEGAFCWSLVEVSDYGLRDLSLAKGWYRGKTSENVTEKSKRATWNEYGSQGPQTG